MNRYTPDNIIAEGKFYHGDTQDYIVVKENKKTCVVYLVEKYSFDYYEQDLKKRYNKQKMIEDIEIYRNKKHFENEVLFWIENPNGL